MKNKILTGMLLLAAGFFTAACSSDDDYSISTDAVVTSITTGDAAVTAISATTYGTVQDLSRMDASRYQVGTAYSTSADPTSGSKQNGTIDENGNVTTQLSNLVKGTTYYYATFVTLQGKVTKYGEVKSFVATDAQVATAAATNVSACKATFAGQTQGISDILENAVCGFKYATSEADVENGVDLPMEAAAASFETIVDGLLPGTTYYYKAYIKLGDGLYFGNVQQFTTQTQAMEYVDLGLSVLWAKYNIGAESESEAGILVGFGDQSFYNRSVNPDDYLPWSSVGTEEDVIYNLSIDGESPMKSMSPSVAQVEELLANTTQTAEEVNGVQGVRFTAKNGNSIFLPVTGYRVGSEVNADGAGYYWTAEVAGVNETYAKTLVLGRGLDMTSRAYGVAVRSVREADPVPVIDVDINKLIVGDIENNGRIRIELYNEWGASKADPGINLQQVKFSKNMLVRFSITGITGNLKDDAPGSFVAGLEYSDPDWAPALWSDFQQKYDAHIAGDGEYTLWMEPDGQCEGAVVFTVDIDKLGANLVDASKVKVESMQLMFDVEDNVIQYYVDNSKIFFNNKDGNGTDGRIELFNEWGATKGAGVDYSDLKFGASSMLVEFTISGIDGNLVEGATKNYKTELSFANQSWSVQYWGGLDAASTTVTGDGTYQVWAPLTGEVNDGPVVWTIELYGLWKDLVDGSKVTATINKVVIPGKK